MHNRHCGCRRCESAGTFEAESSSTESGGGFGEMESAMSEEQEMDLALELLTVSSEAELDQFLGKLIKGAWKGIKKVAKPLGGVLKKVAKAALPMVGGALGSFIPIPGVGTAVGSALGGAISKALEMETESLSGEDRELEVARRFVRIATSAARQVASAPSYLDEETAATQAVAAAARKYLPNFQSAAAGATGPVRSRAAGSAVAAKSRCSARDETPRRVCASASRALSERTRGPGAVPERELGSAARCGCAPMRRMAGASPRPDRARGRASLRDRRTSRRVRPLVACGGPSDGIDLRPLRCAAVRSGDRVGIAAIRAGDPGPSAVRPRHRGRQGADVHAPQGRRGAAQHARRAAGQREMPDRGRRGNRQHASAGVPGGAPAGGHG